MAANENETKKFLEHRVSDVNTPMKNRVMAPSFAKKNNPPSQQALKNSSVPLLQKIYIPQRYCGFIPLVKIQTLKNTKQFEIATWGLGTCIGIYACYHNGTEVSCALGHVDDVQSDHAEFNVNFLTSYIENIMFRVLSEVSKSDFSSGSFKFGIAVTNP